MMEALFWDVQAWRNPFKKNIGSGASPAYFPTFGPAVGAVNRGIEGGISIASIILLVGGLLKFIFIPANSNFGLILSVILFILAGYALSEKINVQRYAVFIPMLAFFIWYFVFDANYSLVFLLYYLLVVGIVLAIFAVFSRGASVRPELLGFVPCLFFFLDLGMIPFLVEYLNLQITPLMESLILWMPWWSLLGLLTLPQQVSTNTFINGLVGLLKIFGIVYLIFILITPAIPDLGHYSQEGLPTAAELAAAQERVTEKIPKKENPFISNMYCLFVKGEYGNIQRCVEQRQEEQERIAFCEDKVKPITNQVQRDKAYETCLKEEAEKKKKEALQAGGTIDRTIRIPTEAKVVIRSESLPKIYVPDIPFPFEVQIANPRQQEIQMDVACKFKKKIGTDYVLGKVEKGALGDFISFRDQTYASQFLCIPQGELNGTYTLEVDLQLLNLQTPSRLQRAFIGNVPEAEKKRLEQEIHSVIREEEALVPAEFAGIYFDLGHATNEVIIENKVVVEDGKERRYKPILLRANIKNLGNGKILKIHNYHIDLPNFQVDRPACLDGTIDEKMIEAYTAGIPLPVCFITDYPLELKQPPQDIGWIAQEFEAQLFYDYQVTARETITVMPQVMPQ